jgi:hypothetical protein
MLPQLKILVVGMTVQGVGVAEGCRITAIVDATLLM